MEEIPAQVVAESHYEWNVEDQPRRAGVTSIGFTGTNSHLIVEEAPSVDILQGEVRPFHLLTLSAKDEEALQQNVKNYQMYLSQTSQALADIAYTANIGRQHFPYRIAVVAKTVEEALEKLKKGEYQHGIATDPYKIEVSDLNDLNKLAELYCQGGVIDWEAFHKLHVRNKIDLPSYPFQHQRYWATSLEPIQPKKSDIPSTKLREIFKLPANQRRTSLINYLQDLVEEVLGSPFDDLEKGFVDLGLTSLMIIDLRQRLQKEIGENETLSETLAFDYPNIVSLADYFESKLGGIPVQRTEPLIQSFSMADPIAIIGIGCRFPGSANDPESFWNLLMQGVDAIQVVPRERWDIDQYYDPDPDHPGKMVSRFGGFIKDIDLFDASFFGISPREAEALDPQQRLVLEVTWETLERAGIAPSSLKNSLGGVFIGASNLDYYGLLVKNCDPDTMLDYMATGNSLSAISGRLSYILGLQGPAFTIDSACSASLVAIHEACMSLHTGQCNLAIAGGVNAILMPEMTINYSRGHFLAPDGRCKTFDAQANGYVRGEGCGILILKRLSDADKEGDPVLAVIKGTSVNQGGKSGGLTVPNRIAQEKLFLEGLRNAQIEPQAVQYVEAHGTGTNLGDPIEMGAILSVYGLERSSDNLLVVGSVKTNMGHLESAAGVAGVIKTVLALQHQTIPKHLHFTHLNPKIHFENVPVKIPTEAYPWPEFHLAAVDSFGSTGTNAHAILEKAPAKEKIVNTSDRTKHILALSAKNEPALKELLLRYQSYLATNPEEELADIAYTANTGRDHFNVRTAFVVQTKEELLDKLSKVNYQIKDIEPNAALTEKAKELLKNQNNQDGILDNLAELYVTGASIDWKEFDTPYHRNKVILPTYPFQKERFWFKTQKKPPKSVEAHPLLGELISLPSEEKFFRNVIDLDFLPYLKDHKIFGSILFPGTAFMEVIKAAGDKLFDSQPFTINNLLIEQPLTLDINKSTPIELLAQPVEEGYSIAVYSVEGHDWIQHAKAEIKKSKTWSPPK